MTTAGSTKSQKYTSLLGLFTVMAMLILTFMWFWVKDYPFQIAPQKFHVYFHEVNGLARNASVLINGVHVGTVENIDLLTPKEVAVFIRMKKPHIVVPEGSRFSIHESGLMGPQCVEIDLPENMEGRKPLDEQSIVYGKDPLTMSVLDRIGKKLDSFDPSGLRNSFHHFTVAADNLSALTADLRPAATHAAQLEDNVSLLAKDLRTASHRVNGMFKSRRWRSDLLATSEKANEAAQHFDDAMTRLQQTVADEDAREDLLKMASEFNESAQNIQLATTHLSQIGADTELRGDAKQIVADARKTVEGVSDIVKKPRFGSDVHSTFAEARRALKKISLVGAQLHQILDKRAPLAQMLFRRPGHLNPASVAGEQQQVE